MALLEPNELAFLDRGSTTKYIFGADIQKFGPSMIHERGCFQNSADYYYVSGLTFLSLRCC